VPDPVQSSTRLSAAVAPFLDDGTLAFIWADMDLTVLRVAGPVMTADAVGQPLTASLPVFIGYEDDLADLRAGKTSALDLPNIAMPGIDRVDGRMHVSVRWHAGEAAFVILIARALGRADLDLELQRQFRARRLAETELVAQAESVHATNKVLAEVNRDLAEFTHVVSHDLKAPMRAMRYFVDDLETSLAGDGPDGGDPHEHLARLRAQSRRMTAMLSSLLSYAKLDRKQDAVEAVDTGALVLAIIASLPRRDGVGLAVSGEWPTIATVPALLDLVLRNLLDNALRYAAPGDPAVEVHASMADAGLTIHVIDNGPGIPEDAREAVFNPFTSLEPEARREANGHDNSGMGLALVRRAVDRVGGRIDAISRPDKASGACFKLCWPADGGA
jgi:signal transduction histidine kinase